MIASGVLYVNVLITLAILAAGLAVFARTILGRYRVLTAMAGLSASFD